MAQPLATTAMRTAKDTRPTVDVEASSRHCLDDAGSWLHSPLLAVKSGKPNLSTHNARYAADRTKRVRPRNRRPDRPTAVLER